MGRAFPLLRSPLILADRWPMLLTPARRTRRFLPKLLENQAKFDDHVPFAGLESIIACKWVPMAFELPGSTHSHSA